MQCCSCGTVVVVVVLAVVVVVVAGVVVFVVVVWRRVGSWHCCIYWQWRAYLHVNQGGDSCCRCYCCSRCCSCNGCCCLTESWCTAYRYSPMMASVLACQPELLGKPLHKLLYPEFPWLHLACVSSAVVFCISFQYHSCQHTQTFKFHANVKAKFLGSQKTNRVLWISVFFAFRQTPAYTARP